MGMFESLTDKLSGVFARITSRGVLNDKDIDEAMREIRVALLEADVALPVVKDFVARVKEEARGESWCVPFSRGSWWSRSCMTNWSSCWEQRTAV